MIRIFYFFILIFTAITWATTTSPVARAVNIDGTIQGQNGAATGTNSGSWETDETRATSTGGVDFYLTWDDNNLYIGWVGGSKTQQHILWIDTDPQPVPTNGTGSTATFNYGNVTATLPFSGNFFVNIQDAYNEYRTNTTGTWSLGTSGALTVSASGTTDDIEAVIPWNTITNGNGRPSSVYFLSYINDPNGGGGTGFVYGDAPSANTNSGGGNQTFTHYFGQTVGGGLDPFGTVDNSLAVELVAFKADVNAGTVDLSWATESESGNLGFIVLRSGREDAGYRTIASYTDTPELRGAGSASFRHVYAYTDHGVLPGNTYWYKVVDVDYSGKRTEHGPLKVRVTGTNGQTAAGLPTEFNLLANYPNPFNPSTVIPFDVARDAHVSIVVFDILGKKVAELVNKDFAAGHYTVRWNGHTQSGQMAPSGIYMYRLTTPGFSQVRQMMLVK